MKEYSILIMYSKELERNVKVYISLPDSYDKKDKCYPVLYMNDGQILFKDYDDYDGESWGIMESYKNNPSLPEVILVGIASGKARIDELLPFSFKNSGSSKLYGGNAKDYMDFIVDSLKPAINDKYRTLRAAKNTGILGISVGGVCATYAANNYTDHFSVFGCMSSAYIPVRTKMVELIKKSDFSNVKKMYLDVGTNESENEIARLGYLESNEEVYNTLKEKIDLEKLKFRIIKDSQHIEEDWDKRFPSIIEYLFSE